MPRKLLRPGKLVHWQVQEKETIDGVIFRTTKVRNRLRLELMARGGKETEVVFIPKKLADRLKDYLNARGAEGSQRIFPITYTAPESWAKRPAL